MGAIVGLMIICLIFGFIAFVSTMVAMYLLYKDIDIDEIEDWDNNNDTSI